MMYTPERAEHFLRLPRPRPGTEQTEALIQRYLMEQRARLIDALAVCESPREEDFAIALLSSGDKDGAFVELGKRGSGIFAEGRDVRIIAQHPYALKSGNIRIDFAIFGAEQQFAVEIDGHDGHKTRAQRSEDARRDRELEHDGWIPRRITGSELYRDGAMHHADELFRRLGFDPGLPPPPPVAAALVPSAPVDEALKSEDWNVVVGALRAAQERGRSRADGRTR